MTSNRKKVIAFLLALIVCFTLSACTKKGVTADNTEYYNTVTNTLKLEKNYTGLSFLDDGIGVAYVDAYTDGDTTRFRLADDEIVNVRYHGVDTPESTGGVEKWGKAASNFTKKTLQKATEIVLEATASKAQHDSYGSRYLGYVWYKTADSSDFKCLNLELVENGFSDNKCINTSEFKYYSYFKKANDFAKSIKLRLYSDLEDPLYTTDPIEMTIKDFWNNTDAYYDSDSDAGSKVTFQAYLKSYQRSNSGTYTFVACQTDPETGETYEINVYTGYDSNNASAMKLGHLYVFYGSVQNYYGSFQISGILYESIYEMDGYSRIIQRDYYLTFGDNVAFDSRFTQTLYTSLEVTSSSVSNGVLTINGKAYKRATDVIDKSKLTPVEYTIKVPVEEGYVNVVTEGKKVSVRAFKFNKDSNVLTVFNYSDLTIN